MYLIEIKCITLCVSKMTQPTDKHYQQLKTSQLSSVSTRRVRKVCFALCGVSTWMFQTVSLDENLWIWKPFKKIEQLLLGEMTFHV